ncbi:hypothetical protein SORBI_3001G243732 [Sorghum bicolor]|uniref:EGF-like domain-containing protein n=1 Tax=Sorghum bicolor TaxID=4558 RepID=A0A1Z5S766_SORBI|nr:hypothetical protein SORBI_3001G243732 [Sorghum bicolor]OQU91754.1 hypothetical protein SORBI_3001G243732 [Sorghum bicolor]
MVVVASSRSPGGVVLLLAAALLLVCTATGSVASDSSTICDTAKCGKGTCSEVPGIIPLLTSSYKCTCDPGWEQPTLLNLTAAPFAPCIIPNCTFDSSCYNFSFLFTPPNGISFTDPCLVVNCGSGDCKKGDGLSYTCECHPGSSNLLNLNMLPCMKNCSFGADCSKLGINPQGAPSSTSSTIAPLPGSALWWRLLQQLLWLAILLLLQVV